MQRSKKSFTFCCTAIAEPAATRDAQARTRLAPRASRAAGHCDAERSEDGLADGRLAHDRQRLGTLLTGQRARRAHFGRAHRDRADRKDADDRGRVGSHTPRARSDRAAHRPVASRQTSSICARAKFRTRSKRTPSTRISCCSPTIRTTRRRLPRASRRRRSPTSTRRSPRRSRRCRAICTAARRARRFERSTTSSRPRTPSRTCARCSTGRAHHGHGSPRIQGSRSAREASRGDGKKLSDQVGDSPWYEMAHALEEASRKVLQEKQTRQHDLRQRRLLHRAGAGRSRHPGRRVHLSLCVRSHRRLDGTHSRAACGQSLDSAAGDVRRTSARGRTCRSKSGRPNGARGWRASVDSLLDARHSCDRPARW